MSRVPELAGLKSGFGALLAGDRALLEQQYRVSGQGRPQAWQLQLQPKDAAVAKQVRELRLYGHGDELRCIESVPVKGDVQRTLLAGAARDAAAVTDAAALTTCATARQRDRAHRQRTAPAPLDVAPGRCTWCHDMGAGTWRLN